VGDPQCAWLNELLEEENVDVLLSGLLGAAAWLRDAPEKYLWAGNVMRRLAICLQKETLPLGLKARAVAALVQSGNSSVAMLFKQMLADPHDEIRQLGALALGMLRDVRAIPDLIRLIGDRHPPVGRAAILALVAIHEDAALEAVADVLLGGEETMRRAAAEALANAPEQGYPTLKEGTQVDDPAVRRAVVFGLARTRQPWAVELIEKLHTGDNQWVVQDAAGQTIESLGRANPRVPQPLPALTHLPWLIEFAGKRGMGVAPGKPAYDLLFLALKEGDEDQKLASIYYLSRAVDDEAVLPLYKSYFSSRGELREAALNALWHTAAAGITLPPPVQFGLR
jgi:HEAT repeat protein